MEFEIIKIVIISVAGTILASLIREFKPEFSIYIIISTCLIIIFLILDKLVIAFEYFKSIYSELSIEQPFIPILFKVIIISYVTDFTAQLCRDAGEGAIAGKTELAGKVLILYLSLPILVSIIEIINGILQV